MHYTNTVFILSPHTCYSSSVQELYKKAPGGNDIAVPLSTQLAPLAKLAEGDPDALANAPGIASFLLFDNCEALRAHGLTFRY